VSVLWFGERDALRRDGRELLQEMWGQMVEMEKAEGGCHDVDPETTPAKEFKEQVSGPIKVKPGRDVIIEYEKGGD